MKLHLPLFLRSALLAACALVTSYASAATIMTEDVTYTSNQIRQWYYPPHMSNGQPEPSYEYSGFSTSSIYDGHTIDLNGSSRKFSYSVIGTPGNVENIIWFLGGGTFKMSEAKDILISGVDYTVYRIDVDHDYKLVEGQPWQGREYDVLSPDNQLDIDISDSNSFTFTKGKAWGDGTYNGALTSGGDVALKNVDQITLSDNLSVVVYRGAFAIDGSKEVSISGNNKTVFDGNAASFNNIDKLTFSGNRDHIFHGQVDGDLSFSNCKTIIFENNSSQEAGVITVHGSNENYLYTVVFENNGDIIFRNNSTEKQQLFNSGQPKFTNVKSVEFTGNRSKTGEVIGQTLVFEGVTGHVYLNENEGGFGELKHTEGLLVTSNGGASGDITARGANMSTVFEMKGNKGTGAYIGLYTGTLTVENFGKVDLSDNLITAPSMRDAVGMFSKMKLDGVNEISIKNNRYVSETGSVSLIQGDLNLSDFGSLDISNNTIGYDAEGKEVIAESSKQLLRGNVNIIGRTEGGLSSKVSITDNKIGGLELTMRTNEHYVLKDLHSLDISRNSGSHTYSIFGRLTLEDIDNVTLSGNTLTISDSTERYVDAVLSAEGISLEGGESFTLSNNTTDATGFAENLYGGALTARLTQAAQTISAKKITISGNKGIGAVVYGGAINLQSGSPVFSGGGAVSITDNGAQAETFEKAQGGAIYASNSVDTLIEFVDNKSVTIRGNYVTDGSRYNLNAIYTSGIISFKAGAGQTVDCYDSLYAGNIININGDAKDEAVYTGTVTFSGEYTEADLKKLNAKYSQEDLLASRTITANSYNVYNGTLVLKKVQVEAKDWKGLNAQKEASVRMENASILAGYSRGSLQGTVALPTAVFAGANTIEAPVINAKGSTWTFNLTAEHLQKAALSISFVGEKSGKFTTADQVFHLSYDPATLATGLYRLVEYNSSLGSWSGSDTLTFTDVNAELLTGEDVYFIHEGNIYTLVYDHTYVPPVEPEAPETPAQRPAATLTWVAGSGAWADSSGAAAGAWKGSVSDLNYYNGDSVVFDSAATVTVAGIVRPADVLVKHAEGQLVITGSDGGQITGATGLTKEGAGELVLNLGNAYTGDTTLKAGTLTVGHAAAMGLSVVQLQGGVLNMGDLAVSNDVRATGTATIVGAESYVGKLTLAGGKLSGGAVHLAQEAELLSGSLANDLVGYGSVVKLGNGTATLSGALSHTGGTSVREGTLALAGAALSGDLTVEDGGTLAVSHSTLHGAHIDLTAGSALKVDLLELAEGDSLVSDGAAIEGNLTIAGGSLETGEAQSLRGELSLSGGTVRLGDTLNVEGSLSSSARTNVLLDVQKLRNLPNRRMVLFTASDTAGVDQEHIYLSQLKDTRMDMAVTQSDVWVQLNCATLTWKQGETATWGVKASSGVWNGEVEDKRFYQYDDVIFDNAGFVELVDEVAPGSISVTGEQDTIFAGSGSIAGDAVLMKKGSGTLEIRTDNSHYEGDVFVNKGTLKFAHDNALGSGSVFINGAVFDGGNHRIGSTLFFSGASHVVNADGAQNVVFESFAAMSGSYTLGSEQRLTIGADGASFTGSFTFAGGTLALTGGRFDLSGDTQFAASQGARNAVSGATIIDVSGWDGLSYGKSYELASFVSETAGVESNFTLTGFESEKMLQRASLSYDGDTLWLNIKRLGMNPEIASVLNRNQLAAYKALDDISENRQAEEALIAFADDVLDLESAADAREVLDSIDGAELATVMVSQIASNMSHMRRLRENIGSGTSLHEDSKFLTYVSAYGDYYHLNSNANGQGIKRSEWGASVGFEHCFGQHLIGLALSGGASKITPSDSSLKYDELNSKLDFYVVCNFGNLRSVTSVGAGSYSYDIQRNVLDAVTADSGDMVGYAFNVQQEFSYTAQVSSKDIIQPFASIESSINRIDAFTENGAGLLSLSGSARKAWATDVTIGARYIHSFDTGYGNGSVMLQAAAVASIGDLTSEQDLCFVGAPGSVFTVTSAAPGRWGYNVTAAFTLPIMKSSSIYGAASSSMRSGSQEVSASVGFRISF